MDNIIYYIGSIAIVITLAIVYLPMIVDMILEVSLSIHNHKQEKRCPSGSTDAIGFRQQQQVDEDE